jgi:hypothetical protein
MSRCNGLSARAGELITLQCTLCVFVQLLLVYDVESALSVLTAALAAVGVCCLLARGARRFCRVVQSVTDGWTARWAATLTMSDVVDVQCCQLMTVCETATWAHRSSVAHLVSLHSSYSFRTPRRGVRAPSGMNPNVIVHKALLHRLCESPCKAECSADQLE